MKYFLLILLCVRVNAQIPVSILWTQESGTIGDLTTVSNWIAGTYGPITNAGNQGLVQNGRGFNPSVAMSVSGTNYSIPPMVVSISNVNYFLTGTRGIKYDLAANTNTIEQIYYQSPLGFSGTDHPNASFGVFIYCDMTNSSGSIRDVDIFHIDGGNNTYLQAQIHIDNDQSMSFNSHSATNGSTVFGSFIGIQNKHLYYMTGLRNGNTGQISVQFFEPTTWALIGDSTCYTNPDGVQSWFFSIGQGEAGQTLLTGFIYWDNVIIDWTNARFPLLPTPWKKVIR